MITKNNKIKLVEFILNTLEVKLSNDDKKYIKNTIIKLTDEEFFEELKKLKGINNEEKNIS